MDSFIIGIDGDAAYKLATLQNQTDVKLTGHVGVGYNLLNSESSTKANFVAGGSNFTTDGIEYDDVVFRGGVGVEIGRANSPISGSVNYDMQTGNDGDNDTISATMKYKY
jgi:hypothetical protein